MYKSLSLLTAAAALAAAPALAESPEINSFEPEVTQAARSPLPSSPDWTGFYAGAQIGFANVDTNVSGSDDDIIGGIVGGYDYDFGQWVIGAGIDYDFADVEVVPGTDLEEIFRLKVRGGYKIGNGLLYGTGGYAYADTNNAGDDDGYFIGGGYEHLVSDNFSVGGEILYHEFNNFNSPVDVEATTFQVRGTFRF